MKSYLDLLQHILDNGNQRTDRTGTGTRSVFGHQWRHNLFQDGFPLLTTKKVHFKSILHELLWFVSGSSDVTYLHENGVTIWDEWIKPGTTDLGPVYGVQWRHWQGVKHGTDTPLVKIDQLEALCQSLTKNPDSRRHIVTAWNPVDLNEMALPPCHTLWQCYVHNGWLSLHLYARSIDSFLGLPFNIASYALLTHMLARVCGLVANELIISFGDLHLYDNHIDQAHLQLSRTPAELLPTLHIHGDQKTMTDFKFEDFELLNYNPQPAIKAPIAV